MNLMKELLNCTLFLSLTCSTIAVSADVLNVPRGIWHILQPNQKALLSDRYVINVLAGNSYGTIIDIQRVDESSRGSNAGAKLGAAYASAAYVDNAFKGRPSSWNYSSTGHLTSQITGALIGSLANQPAVARYRTRYTVKMGNGGIEYLDEIKGDPFTHSHGLCVAIDPIRPIDSEICNISLEQFQAKYALLGNSPTNEATTLVPKIEPMPQTFEERPKPSMQEPKFGDNKIINCKIGLSSPLILDKTTCEAAGGTPIQ